jgi:hypothetical protein
VHQVAGEQLDPLRPEGVLDHHLVAVALGQLGERKRGRVVGAQRLKVR